MAKKQKSKSRLDKYYYLAKDHGFRSRATFKLIQLNKKYNFFQDAQVCIDLCAAPGGWLQAASKFMPIGGSIVGVDLVAIKPVKGCTTFVSDITTQDCRNKLEKELKHRKADIVLHDGAPNVGGNWNHDAYTQSELVLHATKLASEFLKPGGTFVTKVFRSSDYSSLIYVMSQLFKKVEATKPLASRQVSAEIFVICQGYKNVDIDSKLLDPRFALKQIENEEDSKMNNIKSIKALLEAGSNRNRGGYYSNSLYKEKEFSDFVECNNPYQFLYEVNKIAYNTEKSKDYLNSIKQPKGWEYLFADLKVLGKSELQSLIFWRDKIRVKCLKNKKDILKVESEENITETEYKEKKLKEMDEEIKKVEKAKKKRLEVAEKKKERNELRQKLSFLKENNYFEPSKEDFDVELFKYLKENKISIEDLDYKDVDEDDENESDNEKNNEVEEIELSEIDEDKYYEMMNELVEDNIKHYKEDKDVSAAKKLMQKKNKEKKSKRKDKVEDNVSDIEESKVNVEKESESEKDEDDVNNESDSDDYYDFTSDDDEVVEQRNDEEASNTKEKLTKKDNQKIKMENSKENISQTKINIKQATINENNDLKLNIQKENIVINKNSINTKKEEINKPTTKINNFINPLKILKNKFKLKEDKEAENNDSKETKNEIKEQDIENNLSSDTDEEENKNNDKTANQKIKKTTNNNKESLLNKKRKHTNDKINKIEDQEIEFVQKEEENKDDLDIDEIAEIRALAKKMLRKKDRIRILDSSYNRYTFDDLDDAPDWFIEDEKMHSKPNKPVTKDEINTEKEILREINTRTPKKIQEAKNRKKKRLARQLDKIKKKAQVIADQEEIGEGSKLRQIEKLYKKELNKSKPEKKYVYVRSQQKVGKSGRNVKYVDKRLKKDKRAVKRAERKNKSKGNSKKNEKKVYKDKSLKKGIKNRRK